MPQSNPPMKRDPRVDPKPGDVLRNHSTVRTVTSSANRWVTYYGPDREFELASSIYFWQKWAAEAEVIHAAE